MQRSRIHEELVAWCAGKPPLLALVAPTLAFAADPIDHLVRTSEGELLREPLAAPEVEQRLKFYESITALMRELASASPTSDGERLQELCDEYDRVNSPTFDEQQYGEEVLAFLSDREAVTAARKELDDRVRENCRFLTDSACGMTEVEYERLKTSPAFGFLVRVMLDHFAYYRRDPQSLYRMKADASEDGIKAAECLQLMDPKLLEEPTIRNHVLRGGNRQVRNRMARLARGPRGLKKKTVVQSIAGLISCISHCLDTPLRANSIRPLFDMAARCRHGDSATSGIVIEHRLGTGEALTQSLARHRKDWMKLLDPDNSIRTKVRELRAQAA